MKPLLTVPVILFLVPEAPAQTGDGALLAKLPSPDHRDDGKLLAAATDRGDVMLWSVGSWRSHKTC